MLFIIAEEKKINFIVFSNIFFINYNDCDREPPASDVLITESTLAHHVIQ